MSTPRPERDPRPYEHRFHAGNVGDVLKHVALVALLDGARSFGGPLTYVETHAGAGSYRLGPTGEWREGVGRLLERMDGAPGPVARYAALLDERSPGPRGMRYPGSPVLAARALAESDALVLVEKVDETARALEQSLRGDARARVVVGDGLAELEAGLPSVPAGREGIVHVDPPWVEKAEWTRVPDALLRAARARPDARMMLWYPVKSHTRPNAMMKRLQDARLAATLVELVSSPLTVKKNRLNGSGLILVRPPEGLVQALAGTLAWLGEQLATHEGYWSQRVVSWGAGYAASMVSDA